MIGVLKQFAELNGLSDPWPKRSPALDFDGHGWFEERDAETIDWLCERIPTDQSLLIVEVGAWLGKSTRHLWNHGPVWSVDTWRGSPEHQSEERGDCRDRLTRLYEQWLANCWDFRHRLFPLRMSSDQALRLKWPPLDLVFLDSDHSRESVHAECCGWIQHLKPGGILCGHDWLLASVREATQQACAKFESLGLLVVTGWSGNVWWMQLKKEGTC